MASSARTVDIIFRGTDEVSDDVSRINTALGSVGSGASAANDEVQVLNDQITDLGNVTAFLGKAAAAAFAGFSVGYVVKEFVDVNTAVDQFRRSVEFAGNSTETARAEFEKFTKISNDLGLNVIDTANDYSKFVAQIQGSGLSLDQTRNIYSAVAGAISAVGGSSADVGGALFQLGQGISRTRFELEDLKGVFERVPGGAKIFAEAIGVSTEALFKLISQGKIGAQEVELFAFALQDKLGAVKFDSLTAEYNRLQNTGTAALLALGDAGLYNLAADGIRVITEALIEGSAGFKLYTESSGLFISRLLSGDLFSQEGREAFRQDLAALEAEINQQFAGARQRIADGLDSGVNAGEYLIQDTVYALQKYEDAADSAGEKRPFDGLSDSAKKAEKDVAKTALELEKLDNELKIAQLEARVDLDVAKLESQGKVAVAVFEGLATSIESAGKELDTLYDALADPNISKLDKLDIKKQIQEAQKVQEELYKAQIKAAEATARAQNALAKGLASGDALIEIDGKGLQPQLEAFMFEVLKAVQVKTNAEGLSLLLGV